MQPAEEQSASPLLGAAEKVLLREAESNEKGRRENLFDESVAVAHE